MWQIMHFMCWKLYLIIAQPELLLRCLPKVKSERESVCITVGNHVVQHIEEEKNHMFVIWMGLWLCSPKIWYCSWHYYQSSCFIGAQIWLLFWYLFFSSRIEIVKNIKKKWAGVQIIFPNRSSNAFQTLSISVSQPLFHSSLAFTCIFFLILIKPAHQYECISSPIIHISLLLMFGKCYIIIWKHKTGC